MDELLLAILREYRKLPFLPSHRETPEYKASILHIRALVDARTALRGDEMIVVARKAENFKS